MEGSALLQAWIEAIITHAFTRVPKPKQRDFVIDQFRLLERDFQVHISLSKRWEVEVDFLPRLS